jgi:hypothetical protein
LNHRTFTDHTVIALGSTMPVFGCLSIRFVMNGIGASRSTPAIMRATG